MAQGRPRPLCWMGAVTFHAIASDSFRSVRVAKFTLDILKEQAIQDDSANNDQENNSKPNENDRSPGKLFPPRSIGGIFRIHMQVSLSFGFSDSEFRLCLVLSRVRWWRKVHQLFPFLMLLKTELLFVERSEPSASDMALPKLVGPPLANSRLRSRSPVR